MRMNNVAAVCMVLLIYLSYGQQQQEDRHSERRRRQKESQLQREERPTENRPSYSSEPRPPPPKFQKAVQDPSPLDENNSTLTESDRTKPSRNQRQPVHNMENRQKPLINLIFLLLGALLIITFILLLKLIAKKQRQDHPQQGNIAQHVQYSHQISGKLHPQLQLEQEIRMQKGRLHHLEQLKHIKEKYLITSFGSNHTLVKCPDASKLEDDQPSTPVFATPITFRNCPNS